MRSCGGPHGRSWKERRHFTALCVQPCFGSGRPWVHEPIGSLSLSRRGGLGRGGKGVHEGRGSREADWLEDDCPLSPLGGRRLYLSLFFPFSVHMLSQRQERKEAVAKRSSTARQFSLAWSKCVGSTIVIPRVWLYGQWYRLYVSVLHPGGLSLIQIWL